MQKFRNIHAGTGGESINNRPMLPLLWADKR
jgi:hypothetical protein